MRRIGILGGGLAGLTVAFRRASAGDAVILFEAGGRLGGQLWTERRDGFVVEHGAEGFVARGEAVPHLAEDLGILSDLVGQEETRSYGFDGEGLRELAPGEAATFLGFQVPREELGKGIRTFRLGMGQLTEGLVRGILGRIEVSMGTHATSIHPVGERWRISLAERHGEEVDGVVIATGAAAAAPILTAICGDKARALASAPTLSSCTVTLVYKRAAIDHPLDGTGFVVAEAHQVHGFRACTFITSKFAGRAPPGFASLRIFFRPSREDLASMTDEAWIERAEACLAQVLPVRGRSVRAWVSRWPDALPVFDPGHVASVKAVEAALGGTEVLLAGAAFHGSGIDAAVRSAEAAAGRLEAG